ncbi:MAG: hypothetical protein J6A49_08855 [Clostridia bacterium]|nr:hypothetical protein [Clostridia bacterium]
MKKNFIKVLAVISALFILCACGKMTDSKYETTDNYSTTAPSTTSAYNFYTQAVNISIPDTSVTPSSTQPVTETPVTNEILQTQETTTIQQAPIVTEKETVAQTTEKVYEKTGEMVFSDSADNKYIKAVTTKYGVDAKTLAVLYTVPDNDGNIVLQFDGSTDANGKLIRNESTLIAIYSVDKNLNSKCASEDHSLNEYSYGEMKVMFISTTKYIMPEFQEELNG